MDKNDLAIATISWARNSEEEHLLRKAFTLLSALQIPVYVTDGGSGEAFMQFLHNLPNCIVVPAKGKGLWNQVQSSLDAAFKSNKPFVLYTEGDKALFFKDHIETFIAEATSIKNTGIILASRTPQAFSTFPKFQQTSETAINFACAEVTRRDFDYTYGPFILDAQIVSFLKDLKPGIDWGWRPYAFCIASRLGYAVSEIKGDFICPEDQRTDSPVERIYRLKQLHQNIEGVVLAAVATLPD